MIRVNATMAADVRQETKDGRKFLVAPVVMVREGVLNGEFVPADEFKPTAWDSIPVVLAHPTEAGEAVSARDPDVLEEREVGRIFGAHEEGDRLKAEAWVDVEQAKRRGRDGLALLKALQSGTLIEVSTAYRRTLDETPGTHAGERYIGIARDLEPDHLAILLHDTGACSIQDGCGIPRLNQREANMEKVSFDVFGVVFNILSESRSPTFDGTTEAEWSAPTLDDYLGAFPGDRPETSQVADLPRNVKTWIAGHTLLGDPDAEDFRNLSFFPVVGTGGNLNRRALLAVIGGRGAQADIPEAAKSSAQSMARGLLEREFEMEEQRENRMDQFKGNAKKPIAWALRVIANALGCSEILTQEDKMSKDEMVKALLDNGGTGLSREQLESIADDALATMAANLLEQEKPKEEQPNDPAGCDECPDEQPAANTTNVTNAPALSPQAQALLDGIEKRGGVDAFFAQVDAVQANRDKERNELLAALKANKEHSFSDSMLEKMNAEELRVLKRTVTPTLFAPAGDGVQTNGGDGEIVVLKARNPWAKEPAQTQEVQ